MTSEPLVKVYESQGVLAAEVVKAKLEANGIPAMLKYESVGRIIGITVDGLGRVEVHVPGQFAEDALLLVQEDEEAFEADVEPGIMDAPPDEAG